MLHTRCGSVNEHDQIFTSNNLAGYESMSRAPAVYGMSVRPVIALAAAATPGETAKIGLPLVAQAP